MTFRDQSFQKLHILVEHEQTNGHKGRQHQMCYHSCICGW